MTKPLHEILNPEGKQLTWQQWQKKKRDYEEKEKRKVEQLKEVTNDARPGVCECGCSDFQLRALSGGVIERMCKNCDTTILL